MTFQGIFLLGWDAGKARIIKNVFPFYLTFYLKMTESFRNINYTDLLTLQEKKNYPLQKTKTEYKGTLPT